MVKRAAELAPKRRAAKLKDLWQSLQQLSVGRAAWRLAALAVRYELLPRISPVRVKVHAVARRG